VLDEYISGRHGFKPQQHPGLVSGSFVAPAALLAVMFAMNTLLQRNALFLNYM
jgi:hypothetical protein